MMLSRFHGRALVGGLGFVLAVTAGGAQAKREVRVSAHKYAFVVDGQATPRIEVQQGDVVHITFTADDIAHSFTIDEYRIAKRAEPGKPISFDILADKVTNGPVAFYCNLTIDDGCKKMRGEFIVTKR